MLISELPGLRISQANYFSLSSMGTYPEVHFNKSWSLDSSLTDAFDRSVNSTEMVLGGIEVNGSIVALTKASGGDSQLGIVWCNNSSPWQLDMGQMFRISKITVEMLDGSSVSSLDTMLTIKFRKTKNGLWKDALPVRIITYYYPHQVLGQLKKNIQHVLLYCVAFITVMFIICSVPCMLFSLPCPVVFVCKNIG